MLYTRGRRRLAGSAIYIQMDRDNEKESYCMFERIVNILLKFSSSILRSPQRIHTMTQHVSYY